MPGVKIVERGAFGKCEVLEDVECDKLEIIREEAFSDCKSLGSIDLPSARIIKADVFFSCEALVDVKFGSKLEICWWGAFLKCSSLERITIPLKDDLFFGDFHDGADDIFAACVKLHHVDLVEGEVHETIAALHLDGWRNDMNDEIESINHILPDTRAGYYNDENHGYAGEIAQEIRWWIRRVLGKIIHYQAKHQSILDEAANTLQFTLPHDIVFNNILPFLSLPSHTFEVERYVYRGEQAE